MLWLLCQAFAPCRALPGDSGTRTQGGCAQLCVATLPHARPADPMSCRLFLVNQLFHHIRSVSFSFLLSEKSCRHDIISKEIYFHLSSPLRSLGLIASSPKPQPGPLLCSHSASSYAGSHLDLTSSHRAASPAQGADPCMEAGLVSSSAPWGTGVCATCPSCLASGLALLGLCWDLSPLLQEIAVHHKLHPQLSFQSQGCCGSTGSTGAQACVQTQTLLTLPTAPAPFLPLL